MSIKTLHRTFGHSCIGVIALSVSASVHAQIPPIAAQVQRSIERIIGVPGTYVASEGAFKIRVSRPDVTLSISGRSIPGLPVDSWIAFSPEIRRDALVIGELSLLDDEINPVAGAALDAGLQVTGLANATTVEQPRVSTLNVSGAGRFENLAAGLRKCLDAISATRSVRPLGGTARPTTSLPSKSEIDAAPIDAILSMKGTVIDGLYRAAIGRVTLLNGTPIGREMGASTWVVFAGSNQNAVVQGEMAVTADELQRVLKALVTKQLNLISIRNHTVGEHPQLVFVRFLGQGPSAELAKGFRYALDVQIEVVKRPS